MRPDFSLIWGADNAPFTAIEASDYTAGWVFRTGAPPRRVNFDYFQNLSDQRTAWLGEQVLLAVGHEWQDDVTYDAYAITRSPVDGQLYRSLVGSNIGNEPSVSGANWALGIGNDVPENLLTSGIAGSFSNLKASATGTNATVTVTAAAICLKNSSNEQVVINNVSVSPSLSASGANGLDTGVSAQSTWYSKWVIYNPTTQAVAGLLSLSATAPTMPAGYTHKARVGWVRTDGTANKFPLSFAQFGKSVFYKVVTGSNVTRYPALAAGIQGNPSTPTWVSVSLTGAIPPTASIVHYNAFFEGLGASMSFAPNNSFGGVDSITNVPPLIFRTYTANNAFSSCFSLPRESDNAFYASGGTESGVNVIGWEDNL